MASDAVPAPSRPFPPPPMSALDLPLPADDDERDPLHVRYFEPHDVTFTAAQFAEIAAVLRADPPEITGHLSKRVNGKRCHCALGKLGKAAGVSDYAMENAQYDALVHPVVVERFGLHTYLATPIYLANDIGVSADATPEQRAEAVLRDLMRFVGTTFDYRTETERLEALG